MKTGQFKATPRLAPTLEALDNNGYVVLEEIMDPDFLDNARTGLRYAEKLIHQEIDRSFLAQRGDQDLLRLPMKYDASFFKFLEIPEIQSIVDFFITPQAVLRNQTVTICGPDGNRATLPDNRSWHQNFPYIRGSMPVALDVAFLLTPMTGDNGPLMVVPGSHKIMGRPSEQYLRQSEIALVASAGSAILFDGLLWHRATENRTDDPMLMVEQQYTHPVIKQHFDFPRALGENVMSGLSERVGRLLGWEVRLPTSLAEFYMPKKERLFLSMTESAELRYRREEQV